MPSKSQSTDEPPSRPAAGEPPPSQAHAARSTALVIGALGIVFGDIGTSPLYTLQECLGGEHGAAPTRGNVFGVLSLIFWSLTLVVTLKYVIVLMRADNRGEGGIFALLALAPERLRSARGGRVGAIAALAVIGAALLFGDGVITPAISVLSALEGLVVAEPALAGAVVPGTIAILVLLFAVQSRGTGKLGAVFGPVMVVWFLVSAALGAKQITGRPEVLLALSPHHAVAFFRDNGWHGARLLGAVVLAVTGGEALYADMGHFGKGPIRRAWLYIAYPCLVVCYLGQGASLLASPASAAQPYYSMVPRGALAVPFVVLATAATVIASQGLVSSAFSLAHQASRLGYFPRITVKHTSGEAKGQIYVPIVNWGLMIGCCALVLVFQRSTRLAAAFGLAVSGTMVITSICFWVVARTHLGWRRSTALAVLLLFLSLDLPFLFANLIKILEGGYIPLVIGLLFVVIMITWRRGSALLGELVASQARPLDVLLARLPETVRHRVPGTAVFMGASTQGVPRALVRMVEELGVVHETALLVSVTTEDVPAVPPEERARIETYGHGFFRVIMRYGFMEDPDLPPALAAAAAARDIPFAADRVTYVLGRDVAVHAGGGRMGPVGERVFSLISRNARNPTDYFHLPPVQVLEIGSRVDL